MFETLSSYGITPTYLQIGIVAIAAAFVIGMFWQYILIGVGLLFCVYVFAMPSKPSNEKPITSKETVIEENDGTPKEYLQDCMRLTGKKEFDCRIMWQDRENSLDKEL
jgi:hypothetical protein